MVSEKTTDAQEQILELEKEFVKAILQNHAEVIGRFRSDDWIAIDNNGSVATESNFLGAI
jgi:hypothetical protein